MCGEELVNREAWRRLCYGVRDFCQLYKVGDSHQVNDKFHQTGYHSILQHHAILSGTRLVGQRFILMQDNNPKHTSKLCQRYIKNKEEQLVLQLMSLPAQSH